MSQSNIVSENSGKKNISKHNFDDFQDENFQNENVEDDYLDEQTDEAIFSQSEIEELLSNSAKQSVQMKNPFNEQQFKSKQESSLIKKNKLDNKAIDINIHSNFDESDNDAFDDSDEYSSKFQDFTNLPKIGGKHSLGIDANIISKDNIEGIKNYVDVRSSVKAFEDFAETEHNDKSVEIIRSPNGEIETLILYCKCGEITYISFDYERNKEKNNESQENKKDYYNE